VRLLRSGLHNRRSSDDSRKHLGIILAAPVTVHLQLTFLSHKESFHVPVFSYFLIVGSVLTGLLFYANSVLAPLPPPFAVSQRVGLPKPYKTPEIEFLNPAIIVATTDRSIEAKPIKTIRKRKATRIVKESLPKDHYAAYPTREYGKTW
jgi:hypothetical protein